MIQSFLTGLWPSLCRQNPHCHMMFPLRPLMLDWGHRKGLGRGLTALSHSLNHSTTTWWKSKIYLNTCRRRRLIQWRHYLVWFLTAISRYKFKKSHMLTFFCCCPTILRDQSHLIPVMENLYRRPRGVITHKKQPNETTEPDIKSHGELTHQQQLNESTEAGHTHSVTVVSCKNQAGIGLVVIQSDSSPHWPHCEMISNRGYRWGMTQGWAKHTPPLTSTVRKKSDIWRKELSSIW